MIHATVTVHDRMQPNYRYLLSEPEGEHFDERFSPELTPKEKEIWMLFDRGDVAELLARDAFAKGAYMLGAEDREIMLK